MLVMLVECCRACFNGWCKPSKINFLYTCKFCEENKILDNEGKAIKIKAQIKVSPNLIKLLQREGHEIPFNDYKIKSSQSQHKKRKLDVFNGSPVASPGLQSLKCSNLFASSPNYKIGSALHSQRSEKKFLSNVLEINIFILYLKGKCSSKIVYQTYAAIFQLILTNVHYFYFYTVFIFLLKM